MHRSNASRVFAATLAMLAMAVGSACKRAEPPAPPPPEVLVTTVVQKDVPIQAEAVGTTVGFVNAQVMPRVQGYLLKQDYQDGANVKASQLLFEIDDRPYKAALDQALGDLAKEQATLRKNQLDVARYTPLVAKGAVSKEELDNAAQATHASEALVQAAQAAVENARLNLDWTRIYSPIDGVAGIAPVQVGNLVTPSTVLTTVSQVDPMKVTFPITERQYLRFADQIKEHQAKGRARGRTGASAHPRRRQHVSPSGPVVRHGPAGRPADGDDPGAGALPEPRRHPPPGPVRQGPRAGGDHPGRPSRAGASGAGDPGRVPGRGRRTGRQGRAPHGEGRRAGETGCGSSLRGSSQANAS